MGNSSSKKKTQVNFDQSHKYMLPKFMQDLEHLEEVIFDLSEDNIFESINATMNIMTNDDISLYSNLILSQLIYSSIVSQMKDFILYIEFMKQIENKEKEINKSKCELINI